MKIRMIEYLINDVQSQEFILEKGSIIDIVQNTDDTFILIVKTEHKEPIEGEHINNTRTVYAIGYSEIGETILSEADESQYCGSNIHYIGRTTKPQVRYWFAQKLGSLKHGTI